MKDSENSFQYVKQWVEGSKKEIGGWSFFPDQHQSDHLFISFKALVLFPSI